MGNILEEKKMKIEKNIKKCQSNGGEALCTIKDGGGKQTLTYAFAGSIEEPVKNVSDTVEYKAKPEWSNGTNTANIEAPLRKRKKELGYVEVRIRKGGRKHRTKGGI